MLLNLIYPNVCGICKRICKENICIKCKGILKKIERTKIKKVKNKNFNEMAYIFKYEGVIRKCLLDYKFNELGYLYKTFSEIIIKNKKISRFIKKYDIIIPVPVHKKRKKQRGYNQTELIARKVAKELGITFENNVLLKTKNTKPQSTLNKEDRMLNAKGVYTVKHEEKIMGKKVLIIDDIYTTGSTLNECSRVIRTANPAKIGILTIAKD